MPAVPANEFRRADIDQRLLSPKISEVAEEMHERIAEGERKVAFDARQSGSAAGYLPRLFDFHEQLTDEWAKRLYTAHCEAWVQQNQTVSAAFIRAVRDRAIIQLIAVRKSSVHAEACRRGTATSQQPNPIALGAWNRKMNRLAARWNRKLEAEAVATEYRAVQVPSGTAAPDGSPLFDVFISHATEDKGYVGPLVEALEAAGIRVWFDKITLEWGDDLRPRIDRGLTNCRYGIVVFSKAFLHKKKWTEYELDSLFALEKVGRKVILPIWHGITREDLIQYSPAFADRLAKISSTDSHGDIVDSLLALLGRPKPQECNLANGTTSVLTEPAQAMTRDVTEVTLEADYFNHDPDRRSFPCQSVSEVPGKYIDDTSADGGIMRSEIEPPAVVVKGIDAKAVEAMGWKPTRLLFKDARTGESKEFSGQLRDTPEPNTVKFAIHG